LGAVDKRQCFSYKRAPAEFDTGQGGRGNEDTLGFFKVWFRGVHEPKMGFDVHAEALILVFFVYVVVQVGNVSQASPAAVGEDYVESSHAGDCLVDDVDDVTFLGEIALDAVEVERFSQLGRRDGLELVEELESTVCVGVVVGDNPDAGLGKPPSSVGTETGGPGCDKGN
jgi:hypothetical protein